MSPKKVDATPPTPGSIWFRTRPPTRSRGSLDRSTIARATVELLDQDGTTALSLRALAERLGVHATSLYWHVNTRDDLLDLAVDAVFAELASPTHHDDGRDDSDGPESSWTEELAAYMRELRAALLRHPWSGPLAAARPLLGPEALQRSEAVYASLHTAGFTDTALTAAAAAVSNLVIGSVAAETAWTGQDEATARHAMHQHLQDNAERYPTLAGLPTTRTSSWSAQFEQAMDALLRGLVSQQNERT